MPPTRARTGVMVTLLGLVAVLGIVWLIRSATTNSENTSGVDTHTNSAGTPDGGETGGGDGDTPDGNGDGTATDGGGTPNGGKTPGGGGHRSVHLNGVNLQGGGDREGCVTVINKTATPAVIESVSFVFVDRPPTKTTVSSDNGAHCFPDEAPPDRDTPCDGLRLIEGKQCLTGAVLAPDAGPGEYTVEAVVHTRFQCDNDKIDPCDALKGKVSPPPSPQNPALIRSEGVTEDESPLRATIVVEGKSSSPPEDSFSPETPSVPEISPSSESDSPPLPDSSPSSEGGEDEE
ncbi:hypothetical protein [Streptomyces sp. NPDC051677]|uniref:hypothetical protein n=1 Tax=Streptomyces sp. NPDC051677 TaxID=3365669 RepID=UPI0037D321AF